jgi:uncharacterized membrane protein HdeD (DUF308 family)
MEGPTPISALIHAATMVAAGVYMLARISFLIQASPEALSIIAWIGTITAVMAALIATQQNDIKRILAYSTLSQLGYMVMAIGLASGEAAMFHLFTHAFFKALLFLGAGSIIVMLHHEQNIWKMGGLAGRLGITFLTFMVGTLALATIYPDEYAELVSAQPSPSVQEMPRVERDRFATDHNELGAALLYNDIWRKGKTVRQTLQTFPILLAYYHVRVLGYVVEAVRLRFQRQKIERVDVR